MDLKFNKTFVELHNLSKLNGFLAQNKLNFEMCEPLLRWQVSSFCLLSNLNIH